DATVKLLKYTQVPGKTVSRFEYQENEYELELQIPGEFNVMNALAAITAAVTLGTSPSDAAHALATFRSTSRRAEYRGTVNAAPIYDDYAHHPDEVLVIIHAFREWYPHHRLVVAFQPHTFSRTRTLFNEFVKAFVEADEVVMIDIFASAREAADTTMTSDLLCQAIEDEFPDLSATNYHDVTALAKYLSVSLTSQTVLLTLGAGSIYEVIDHLQTTL
ncbi:MAG: Mur ligase family protein, partial [bacterium]|nr:Mur ligase family protein [bacterium]